MITSNPEHKKAKLKELVNAGKVALSLSIAGTIVSVMVFMHTNTTKKHDITINNETLDFTIEEILSEDVEFSFKDDLIEEINETTFERDPDNIVDVDGVFDSSKKDEDVVEIDNEFRDIILRSLGRNDDINNPEAIITVGDLKQISELTGINDIWIQSSSDISWLNYCDNLRDLDIEIDDVSYRNLSQIKSLNSLKRITINNTPFAERFNVNMDDESFSFLKQSKNLKTIEYDPNIINIKELDNDDIHLILLGYGADSPKLSLDVIEESKTVEFAMMYGTGVYDFAMLYDEAELAQLMATDTELIIRNNNWKILDKDEFFAEVKAIQAQINEIVDKLNIDKNMSDEEKLNKVLEYVLKSQTYSETSKKIQQEKGYESNFLGQQPEELGEDLMKYSYKNGYLYGALNPDGKPVCGSYAALMKVLLNRVGIEAYNVASDYHAYNLVNVDGEYYVVDATVLDKDIIDIDEITKNNAHLLNPNFGNKAYDTKVIPDGVVLPKLDVEETVDKMIYDAKREYLVKVNNQVMTVSLAALMSILAGLGLAASKRKLSFVENLEKRHGEEKLEYFKYMFDRIKSEYEDSNLLKKAYMKLSKLAEFEKWQEEIEILEKQCLDESSVNKFGKK